MIKYLFILLLLPVSVFTVAQEEDVVKNSSDWRGMIKLARDAYHHKDYQKAMLFYKTALEVIPKDVDLADEIAQTQFRLDQFDAAKEIYEKRTSGNIEEKARAFHNLGNIAMQNKDYDAAIDNYKNALRNDPKNAKTRYNLSQAIRKKKEQEKQNPPPPKGDGDDDKKDKKDDQKKDKKEQKKKPENPGNQNNPSSLSDNAVERELDKLMKKESETKRKLAGSKEGNSTKKSTKEW
jgi:Ca-activated chloride channel homolog